MHRPVLAAEAIEALAVRADGIYIDGTFGRGGHSRAILDRLGPQGRLVALDRDPQARAAARELRDGRFMFLKHNFGTLAAALDAAGVRSAHGMLFDLGISSPLPDEPARAVSFRADGRLAVISFQSLEDRIVKRFMQHAARPDVPRELPLRAIEMPQPALKLIGRAIRPSAAETAANPRARSATLRVAERTAAPYIPSPYRIEPDARWRN